MISCFPFSPNTSPNPLFLQLLAHLKDMALGADAVEALWVAYQAARAEEEAMQQSRGPQGASAPGPAAPGAPPVIAELAVRVGGKALGQTSRLIQILKLLHEVGVGNRAVADARPAWEGFGWVWEGVSEAGGAGMHKVHRIAAWKAASCGEAKLEWVPCSGRMHALLLALCLLPFP